MLFCVGLLGLACPAHAQMSLPDSTAGPDGRTLFRNQCATCHADAKGNPDRQGPNLYGVVGRKAGSEPGFHYSGGFAKADFAWDDAYLDQWLANPQSVIPGTNMMYRQAKPGVRQAIIRYLTEQK
jgi:cytochrome c